MWSWGAQKNSLKPSAKATTVLRTMTTSAELRRQPVRGEVGDVDVAIDRLPLQRLFFEGGDHVDRECLSARWAAGRYYCNAADFTSPHSRRTHDEATRPRCGHRRRRPDRLCPAF